MSVQDQLEQARALIKERKFDEARAILNGIDHPKAKEWLDNLDRIAPSKSTLSSPIDNTPTYSPSPSSAYANASAGASPVSTGSSGGIGILGILVLLITAVVGGVAVGAALHFSGRFIYLICVSVVIASALSAFIMQAGVKFGRVRNGTLALIFGILMGVVSYGTFRYGDYLWFLEEVRAEDSRITNEDIDYLLELETGSSGFLGYVKLEAQEGLSISRARDVNNTGGGIDLPESLTWVYWGIELLIIIVGPTMTAMSQASEPFCENTDNWLEFGYAGSVPNANADQFLQAMQMGDFKLAGTFVTTDTSNITHPYLMIETGDCGADQPTGMLRVQAMRLDGKGRADNKKVVEATLPRQAIQFLRG